jgi:hypothetical protein
MHLEKLLYRTKSGSTLCGHNAVFQNLQAGGALNINHCPSKVTHELFSVLFPQLIILFLSKHIVTRTVMSIDVWFALVTRFTGLFQRNYNYSAIASSHTVQFTAACTESSRSALPSPVPWYQLPTADIPLPLGSRTARA